MLPVFFVILLTIQTVLTADSCAVYDEDIPGLPLTFVNFGTITKTVPAGQTLNKTFITENVRSVVKEDDRECPYIDLYLEDGLLVAKASDAIATIDQDLIGETLGKYSCEIYIDLVCEDGILYQKTMVLYIQDVNVHEPEFNQDSYVFKVVMPIAPGMSLTGGYKKIITVQDIDFSTRNIRVELLDSSGSPSTLFTLTATPADDVNKRLYCDISTSDRVNFQQDVTLILRATDDSTDPEQKVSEVEIVIKKDITNSGPCFHSPEFPPTLTAGRYLKR